MSRKVIGSAAAVVRFKLDGRERGWARILMRLESSTENPAGRSSIHKDTSFRMHLSPRHLSLSVSEQLAVPGFPMSMAVGMFLVNLGCPQCPGLHLSGDRFIRGESRCDKESRILQLRLEFQTQATPKAQ